jgi:hypothetical protein
LKIEQIVDSNGVNNKKRNYNYIVRPGISKLLDLTRDTYQQIIEDIYTLCTEYKSSNNVLSLKLMHTATKGFHL